MRTSRRDLWREVDELIARGDDSINIETSFVDITDSDEQGIPATEAEALGVDPTYVVVDSGSKE